MTDWSKEALKDSGEIDKGGRCIYQPDPKNFQDHGNSVEQGNWPVEVDLDACRNF